MKRLSVKIWLFILLFIVITISFMYILTDILYERLYVADSEAAMIEVGQKLQTQYRGNEVTDAFVQVVEEYNQYSNYNVFAVRNPRELSACVPFEVDYHTLIGGEERTTLLQGDSVTKIGYEERFGREVISVILPLVDENRLEGIIYMYYPLAKISELASNEIWLLVVAATGFTIFVGIFGIFGLRRILRPLEKLYRAVQQMRDGHYETRVEVESKDEIGQLSQAFNQMANSIQQEDESQKAFLSTISHELRTPISYIKGYSELMERQKLSESESKNAITLISHEAARMERLMSEILQLARKEEVTAESHMPLVLAECIREATTLLNMKLIEHKIILELQLDEDIIVNGEETKIKQIIINLLENAICYSEPNSSILVKTFVQKDRAMIQVMDHGIGIAKEDLDKVTQRFYRVNKARSRADGGSGLGLSIVDQMVKQHNGSIHFQSELGVGTTVTIELPIIL